MKHVQGPTLAHIAGGIKDHKQRGEYVNAMKPHVAAKAAEYAQHRGILHTYVSSFHFSQISSLANVDWLIDSDLNMNNVRFFLLLFAMTFFWV
jgi:hypothetical protein